MATALDNAMAPKDPMAIDDPMATTGTKKLTPPSAPTALPTALPGALPVANAPAASAPRAPATPAAPQMPAATPDPLAFAPLPMASAAPNTMAPSAPSASATMTPATPTPTAQGAGPQAPNAPIQTPDAAHPGAGYIDNARIEGRVAGGPNGEPGEWYWLDDGNGGHYGPKVGTEYTDFMKQQDPAAFNPNYMPPTGTPTNTAPSAPQTSTTTGADYALDYHANGLPASNGAPASNPAGLTTTTPQNALTNSTITGPDNDRFKIAKDQIDNWNAMEEPKFDRNIRDLSQNAAGRGQIGSGMVRGSFRDALNDFDTRRTTAQSGFLTDALSKSMDDAYRNVGIEQQQQQFQSGEQGKAFDQNVTVQRLMDSEQGQNFTQQMQAMGFNAQQVQQAFENAYRVQQLSNDQTGQAFYRALQQMMLGSSGDPADFYKWIAGQYAGNSPTYTTTA